MKTSALSVLIISILAFNISDSQADSLKYRTIFRMVLENIELNYDQTQYALTDFKEFVFVDTSKTLLACVHLHSIENKNDIRGSRRCQGNLINKPSYLIKGEVYGDLQNYGYTTPFQKTFGGNSYLNNSSGIIFDLSLRKRTPSLGEKILPPPSCPRASIMGEYISREYVVLDSVNGEKSFWILEESGTVKFKFDKQQFLSSTSVDKNIKKEKRLVREWENSLSHYKTTFLISKDDYAIIQYDTERIYSNNVKKTFIIRYRNVFEKIKKKYFCTVFEGLLPRFDNDCECGFNNRHLYTYVFKSSVLLKDKAAFEEELGLTKMKMVDQLPYEDFCNVEIDLKPEIKDEWKDVRDNEIINF
ncbi:MAG: hypothetical protein MI866_03040 [Bacteroidales bacterium]|nr:hypothetical protein [Bacteroidales bacterium]